MFWSFSFETTALAASPHVFDVRDLPGPDGHPLLRQLTGRDLAVIAFLKAKPEITERLADIVAAIEWQLAEISQVSVGFVTFAIGSERGRHRSVYMADRLAAHFGGQYPGVIARHDMLDPRPSGSAPAPAPALALVQPLALTLRLQESLGYAQALRFLQMPTVDLRAHIGELIEYNLMLKRDKDAEDATGAAAAEATAASALQSLRVRLLWKLRLARLNPRELAIGSAIIDAIGDDGYLRVPLEDLAATLPPEYACNAVDVGVVLRVVQGLEPTGVGARTTSECLLLQLALLDAATPGLPTARELAHSYLEQVVDRDIGALRRGLRTSEEDLELAMALVRACHPRPGSAFGSTMIEYVVPDLYVRRMAGAWSVEFNGATLPRVRVNHEYAKLLGRGADHATLRAQLHQARWLLWTLDLRRQLLVRIARIIVDHQEEFLARGDGHMRPMTLTHIARVVHLRESTVLRVLADKSMDTPHGTVELLAFFRLSADSGGGFSAAALCCGIRNLIAREDPSRPLSDFRIAVILSAEGMAVTRRTVAKHRERLRIPPALQRKRS